MTRRRPCTSPTTTRSASTPKRRASPATRSGTSPHTSPEQYPLLLHFPYFDLYRKQVVKQADLVLAMHLRGGRLHRRGEGPQLRLLRGAHRAGLFAVGLHPGGDRRRSRAPRPGPRLPGRARPHGPQDLEHNTRDGLHLAALAGTWIALVRARRMRERNGTLCLPPLAGRHHPTCHCALGETKEASHRGDTGAHQVSTGRRRPLLIFHDGEEVKVSTDNPASRPTPKTAPSDAPAQPYGREPIRAHGGP